MKMRISILSWLAVSLIVLASACASGNTHKKLKPGKPIPCPQKDC
jgi:hypothetical protein